MLSPAIRDVLIIGGGPAGLAVALGLARQLYTATVFDSRAYRNAKTAHMHNVVGWDHVKPAEFRTKARQDILSRYDTIAFADGVEIVKVEKTPQGRFEATDAEGVVHLGKKLVLGTGMRDVYPAIEGYGDCWVKGIFHCLFCHGYEERGCASVGVIAVEDVANSNMALHMARMAKRLTEQVTVYTNGAEGLTNEIQAVLKGSISGIRLDERKIAKLTKGEKETEVDVAFVDGETVTEGFLVHKPKGEINGPFARQLGLEITPQGAIKTSEPFHETGVSGVFAVGDCASWIPGVPLAMASGAMCAAGLVAQLGMEDF